MCKSWDDWQLKTAFVRPLRVIAMVSKAKQEEDYTGNAELATYYKSLFSISYFKFGGLSFSLINMKTIKNVVELSPIYFPWQVNKPSLFWNLGVVLFSIKSQPLFHLRKWVFVLSQEMFLFLCHPLFSSLVLPPVRHQQNVSYSGKPSYAVRWYQRSKVDLNHY